MENKNEINNDLELISKLQIKKNKLRTLLKEKGILVKGAVNDYDNYEYFSEAQYKELFTELLSECKLELDSTERSVHNIDGTDKQKYGVVVTLDFTLTDIDTGYSICSTHSGIAFDKGDKGIYKAKTGALKYFFATTFLVATKDDPERESQHDYKKNIKNNNVNINNNSLATSSQLNLIKTMFDDNRDELKKILTSFKKKKINELTVVEASKIIKEKKEGNK